MVTSTIRPSSFIIDFRALRHMVLTREAFSSLNDSNGPKIVLVDDSKMESKGKGRIDLDHGSFNNVLYVSGLVANLFSVYWMTHIRPPKKVVFTPK